MTVTNLFADFKPGEFTPWRVVHRGIDYPGEIVIAETWRPELGRKITEGDIHFRIVVLTAEPPKEEVERFLRRLRQALKEQQRRLSSGAVRHILARSGEKRIDQFIKVVQTSNLSPLVNVLDDELVDFLRHLLQEAHIEIEWRPTVSELAQKFPSLEEGEIDVAAAEFAKVLKKAFAKAKKEHPGKRVRLSFKE